MKYMNRIRRTARIGSRSPQLVELGTAAALTLGQGAGGSESKRYIYNSSAGA